MLSPSLLRKNINLVAKKLARRKFIFDIDRFLQQESLRKFLQKKLEVLRIKRKNMARIIGEEKSIGKNVESLCQEAHVLAKELTSLKLKYRALQCNMTEYALSIPNIPDDEIPNGLGDEDNLEIMRWGNTQRCSFPLKDHIDLGKSIGGLDFFSAAKLTGSRFVVMKGKIASLHRALIQFMMDFHVKYHGYEEYYLPYLVNKESLYGAGQLPKFYNDLFHIKNTESSSMNFYTLISTGEVPLINLVRNIIIDERELPMKMVAHTPCFRAEAGSYGHSTRGLIRMHQFDKVEMVQFVHPDKSTYTLEEITGHSEHVLQKLKLPYRKMLLCTGSIGFSACKTYDLEVWFPSQKSYCEIASCSNVGDFQARRIKARYREKLSKKTKFLHTLNASGVAVGRALAAVLENYQLQDGRIEVPQVLLPYMNGTSYIS
ncbi:serine--tRNA ligase [Candidatus Blochmannia ocreatus (nom. nud.)]|uniref:Serine--tRNA ligase n=1 Tax=Candidatus Blochmannia ocreatus (nom. nud.) TaxID=251538 RepID=A0ABY4SSB9_9ENTR|nr:serine--tRNA ligase [Candidatus Blochmannia ocreatus]URJ24891.1 serine--tRNA ligase [Candidatus Blochmannia ocreatus]